MTDTAHSSQLADASRLVDEELDVHTAHCWAGQHGESIGNVGGSNSAQSLIAHRAGMANLHSDGTNGQTMGARVKMLRVERGVSQMEVAVAVGISRPSLAGIETDEDLPGRDTLFALADYFEVFADWLFRGKGSRTLPDPDQFVENVDELALLRFWRTLDEGQRDLMVRMLGYRGREANDAA